MDNNMNNNDMSNMMKNFAEMLSNQEMPENIKNILNNMNMNSNGNNYAKQSNSENVTKNSNSSKENNSTSNQNNGQNNIFGDIDINTILKIQKIMSSLNNDKQNDSRTNLLMSLKPYLKDSRKNKVDQYIQLMKMGKVFEIMNPLGGDTKNV